MGVWYGSFMTRRTIDHTDPRELAVQISLRLPFWYREQLMAEARSQGVTVPNLVLDAVQRVYVPKPPK
jgi:hypothetical protein